MRMTLGSRSSRVLSVPFSSQSMMRQSGADAQNLVLPTFGRAYTTTARFSGRSDALWILLSTRDRICSSSARGGFLGPGALAIQQVHLSNVAFTDKPKAVAHEWFDLKSLEFRHTQVMVLATELAVVEVGSVDVVPPSLPLLYVLHCGQVLSHCPEDSVVFYGYTLAIEP